MLKKATLADRRLVRMLFSYFCHDLAEYEQIEIRPDGHLGRPDIRHLISTRGHHTLLIMHDRRVAGFVVVTRPPYHSLDHKTTIVQMFFVLKGHRRQGVGTEAVRKVLRRFPGKYAIAQIPSNRPATRFWRAALRRCGVRHTERTETHSGTTGVVQRFFTRR